jgi:hypothetical protein
VVKRKWVVKTANTKNKMVPMYKRGGKATTKKKSSFMEESKEITFGNKPKPMEYKEGGKKARLENRAERVMGRAQKNWKKAEEAMEYDRTANPETSNATGYANKKYNKAAMQEERAKKIQAKADAMKKSGGLYSAAEKSDNVNRLKEMHSMEGIKKKTGGKSMEPGGGGRFAKMVSKLKGEGKSEDSAKSIAASIGRKKYGKSKFQAMAAAGKKGMGGMSDSTSANDAGMEMMENMDKPKKRKKVDASGAARKRGNAARKNQKRGRTGCWSGECTGPESI